MKEQNEGCNSSDICNSGSCNKMNSFDWFSGIPLPNGSQTLIVEVSFKGGARKGFFLNSNKLDLYPNEAVIVDSAQGYDIGCISLTGELVKLQMKKKNIKENADNIRKILRKANPNDIKKLKDLRAKEAEVLVTARVISRKLGLDMKIGDVEYQGDGKKITIYYTANSRIDFRELVKQYANTFKLKIEMRQIGYRQEASRIGGMGPCGRELCCSSWLSNFDSVSTGAARYQQLSINSDKLSGQCGRLKCCLNYELDTYLDALKSIPKKADKLRTEEGVAFLRKTDIFKQEMTYFVEKSSSYFKLSPENVKKVIDLNKKKEFPKSLAIFQIKISRKTEDVDAYDISVLEEVSIDIIEKKKRRKNKYNKRRK